MTSGAGLGRQTFLLNSTDTGPAEVLTGPQVHPWKTGFPFSRTNIGCG